MLFIEMLRQAITDLFCFGAKSSGVYLFLRRICKLTLTPRIKMMSFITFSKKAWTYNVLFKCISLSK